MEKLLLLQLLAHILGDFFLQRREWCEPKGRKGFCSGCLYWHILIIFAVSLALTPSLCFIVPALIIACSHLIIDGAKSYLERWDRTSSWASYIFVVDQILHLSVIVGVVWVTHEYIAFPDCVNNVTETIIAVITGCLLCMKPANIVIKNALTGLGLSVNSDTKSNDSLDKAGRWIGTCERLLVLALIMLGSYEAIAFIIAAKSILRYNQTGQTEYVLVGTLLSFVVAVVIGILLRYLYFYDPMLAMV